MGKAAVNALQSKRFTSHESSGVGAKRLDCGGFSTAFGRIVEF